MSDQGSQLAPDDPQPDDRFVTVRGVRLRYADWGDSGPLMLLLHGDMRTARSWDAVARDLCNQFHVLSLDSRGHGDSDWPTTGYNFAERAKDLEAFCDALNLRNVLGVGHSTGGVVMSLLADTRRDIFKRLTLLEPMVTVNEKFQRMVSTRATSPRRTWGSRPELYDYLKAHRMTGRWREDVIRDVVAHEAVKLPDGRLDMKWSTDSMKWSEREGDYLDLKPIFRRLDIPILFISSEGRADGFVELDPVMAELPDFSMLKIRNTEHNMYMNRPDAISWAINAFVQGQEVSGTI